MVSAISQVRGSVRNDVSGRSSQATNWVKRSLSNSWILKRRGAFGAVNVPHDDDIQMRGRKYKENMSLIRNF
jgi:hypothetical protein